MPRLTNATAAGQRPIHLSGFKMFYLNMFYGLFIGAGILLANLRVERLQRQHSLTLGQMTQRQALDRAEALCRSLAPWAGEQYLSATPNNGAKGHYWFVVCRDIAGRDTVRLTWNADTDEPYLITAWPPVQDDRGRRLLTDKEVIQRTGQWIEALGLGTDRAIWYPIGVPKCVRHQTWTVHWAAAGRKAMIEIDAHSGALTYAAFWHTGLPSSDR